MNSLLNILGTASVAFLSQGVATTAGAANTVPSSATRSDAERVEELITVAVCAPVSAATGAAGTSEPGGAASASLDGVAITEVDPRDEVVALATAGDLAGACELWREVRSFFEPKDRYYVERELARRTVAVGRQAEASIGRDVAWLASHRWEFAGQVLLIREGRLVATGRTLAEARTRAGREANGCLEVRITADGSVAAP